MAKLKAICNLSERCEDVIREKWTVHNWLKKTNTSGLSNQPTTSIGLETKSCRISELTSDTRENIWLVIYLYTLSKRHSIVVCPTISNNTISWIYKMEDQNLHCRHIMLFVCFFFTSNKAKMRLKRAIKCVLCTKKDAVSIWMIPTEIDTDKIWVLVDENKKKMTWRILLGLLPSPGVFRTVS